MELLNDIRDLPSGLSSLELYHDAACSWVRRQSEIWSRWIPVDTNCFLGYGLVDEHGMFLSSMAGGVSCEVCPAGTYSENFADSGNSGRTRRCTPCPLGTSQAKAASSHCEACRPGTAAFAEGSVTCTPCPKGSYQDAAGETTCVRCSNDTTTLLRGATAKGDCVCKTALIRAKGQCVPCVAGLSCPSGSTVDLLSRAGTLGSESDQADAEEGETPQILPGFFSWPERPLHIYKCPDPTKCPGGLPGSCVGGRLGPACGECPSGMYWTNEACTKCGISMVAAWILGICGLLIAVICVYYFVDESYGAKTTLAECAKMGLDMMLSFMQNLGVLNAVSVPWPDELQLLFQFSAVFILNLKSLGFNCAAAGDMQQYLGTVFLFLGVTLSWPCIGILLRVPCLKQRGLAWDPHRTIGVMGGFLQMIFTTLCNVGLVPFMCISHPSGSYTILKYPNTHCGGPDHLMMQVWAVVLLCVGMTHFILCCWAIHHIPAWSIASRRRLASTHFLIANFKPSAWWFGLILLMRGPLISLPTVIATDLPGVNLVLMLCVWLAYFSAQQNCLPWKAPLLNLVDGISTFLLLVLLGIALHLEPVVADSTFILEVVGCGVYYLSVAVIAFVFLCSIFLMVWQKCSGARKDHRIMNLGDLPEPEEILLMLEQIYLEFRTKEVADGTDVLIKKMSLAMSAHDLRIVQKALNILASDCELGRASSSNRIAANRISKMSRKSLASLQPERLPKVDESEEEHEDAQEEAGMVLEQDEQDEQDEPEDPELCSKASVGEEAHV